MKTKKTSDNNIKALRKKLGLSQTMFATLMRVSNKAVEKWEQGANPVTNGNAVAMVMFDRNPSLVNMFIERSEGTFEPDISDISVEEEPYIKNLELAKAK